MLAGSEFPVSVRIKQGWTSSASLGTLFGESEILNAGDLKPRPDPTIKRDSGIWTVSSPDRSK